MAAKRFRQPTAGLRPRPSRTGLQMLPRKKQAAIRRGRKRGAHLPIPLLG